MKASLLLGFMKSLQNPRKSLNFRPKQEGPEFSKTIEEIRLRDEDQARFEESMQSVHESRDPVREREPEPQIRRKDTREEPSNRYERNDSVRASEKEASRETSRESARTESQNRDDLSAESTKGTSRSSAEKTQQGAGAAENDPRSGQAGGGSHMSGSASSTHVQEQNAATSGSNGSGNFTGLFGNPAIFSSGGPSSNYGGFGGDPIQAWKSARQAASGGPLSGQSQAGNPGQLGGLTFLNANQAGTGQLGQAAPGQASDLPKVSAAELESQVLAQLRSQLPSQEGHTRIPLVPSNLGEIRARLSSQNGRKFVRINATNDQVQSVLAKNFASLQSVFTSAGLVLERGPAVSEAMLDSNQTGAGATFDATLSGLESGKNSNAADTMMRSAASMTRAEALLAARYGIRNLHEHVLEQIRVRMEGAKGEARIRLHPPELGEIKIHMIMEDRALVVRMEVSETMTRSMLERDLQQLKDSLADAGIDVGRFDITHGEERPYKQKGQSTGNAAAFTLDGEGNGDAEDKILQAAPGTVYMGAQAGEIDYLVY